MVCMTQVDRLSVTMPPEIGTAVREAAARQGTSVSNWMVAAAAQRAAVRALAGLDRVGADPLTAMLVDQWAAAVRKGADLPWA